MVQYVCTKFNQDNGITVGSCSEWVEISPVSEIGTVIPTQIYADALTLADRLEAFGNGAVVCLVFAILGYAAGNVGRLIRGA